jgi:hypothetical protein
MNAKQTNAIEIIKKEMMEGRYEVKTETVEDCGFFVSFSIEVGMPNDQGTLASVLCRNYRHFFIGKRGGVTLKTVSMGNHRASPKTVTGLFNSVRFLPF